MGGDEHLRLLKAALAEPEFAYQVALRGFLTSERTGKPHIVRIPPTGDAESFLVSDPRHRNSRRVVISGCEMAVSRKSALQLLGERIKRK